MDYRPCPELCGGYAAMRIPTATEGRGRHYAPTRPPLQPVTQVLSFRGAQMIVFGSRIRLFSRRSVSSRGALEPHGLRWRKRK